MEEAYAILENEWDFNLFTCDVLIIFNYQNIG